MNKWKSIEHAIIRFGLNRLIEWASFGQIEVDFHPCIGPITNTRWSCGDPLPLIGHVSLVESSHNFLQSRYVEYGIVGDSDRD